MKNGLKMVLAIFFAGMSMFIINSWHETHAAIHYVQSKTPTLFIHGWGSSSHAEEKMTAAARNAGVTKTIIQANVDRRGNVTFNRHIPANAVNPIVEVNLADNKLAGYGKDGNYVQGYHHGGTYIKAVVLALEKQHHYPAINLVGHSMGNLEIINYINDNSQSKQLPRVNHLVAIAGHYNGLVGQPKVEQTTLSSTGKPDWMDSTYRELLGLRKSFPRTTRVLNIYGDLLDGSHSDKDVPVNSAKSLRYLVADRAKSYREVEIRGKAAQHSRLHNNTQVNQELINFLWVK